MHVASDYEDRITYYGRITQVIIENYLRCLPPQKCVANLHDNSKSHMAAIVNKVYCL